MSETPKITSLNSNLTPTHQISEDEQEAPPPVEEETDIDLAKLKAAALKSIKSQAARDGTSQIVCRTPAFMKFAKTKMCDQMIIASLFYVSSTLTLTSDNDLSDEEYAEQEKINTDSTRILSSLYCQLLLSPESSKLAVREERLFYETLIYYLEFCVCYSIPDANQDTVYELMSAVFRKGIDDPHSRKESEFLPITEIVRRHWLAQRVPGKNRSGIPHQKLQGTTSLIEPMCEKRISEPRSVGKRGISSRTNSSTVSDAWDTQGFPVNTKIPFNEQSIPKNMLFSLPQAKTEATSHVPTREITPRKEKHSD